MLGHLYKVQNRQPIYTGRSQGRNYPWKISAWKGAGRGLDGHSYIEMCLYVYLDNFLLLLFKKNFLCGPFLKSLLNLLQYRFCFMFWFFGYEACGILAPRPGIKPALPALEGEVLTTGLPVKFLSRYVKTQTLESYKLG